MTHSAPHRVFEPQLDGWKGIAVHFGRTLRTIQHWERDQDDLCKCDTPEVHGKSTLRLRGTEESDLDGFRGARGFVSSSAPQCLGVVSLFVLFVRPC